MESEYKKEKGTSISQILDKFHKIKESRFQGKEKAKNKKFGKSTLFNTKLTHSDSSISNSMHDLDKINAQSPSKTDKRMSLPSIFHPMKPLPASESHGNETIERQLEKDIRIPVQGPRFSMSYVLQAYSKANIPEVEAKAPGEKEYEDYIKEAENNVSSRQSKKSNKLSQKERESPGRSHDRKRFHGYRKLPPLGLDEEDDVSSTRSRSRPLFSY